MLEMSKEDARLPGSIPGGGYKSTTGNHEGSSESVQCCSVEIAKMVSLQGGNAPCTENHLTEGVSVGEGESGSGGSGARDAEGRAAKMPPYSATTKCEGCGAGKCATHGCTRPRAEEGFFCVACIASGKAQPSTTCDNLPAVGDVIESPTVDGGWSRRVIAGVWKLFVAGEQLYRVRFEGEDGYRTLKNEIWRWPFWSAETKCGECGEFRPCNCSRPRTKSANRCARLGCENEAFAGDIFCAAHLCEGANRGSGNLTCDNLPAVVSPEELAQRFVRIMTPPGEQAQCDLHGVRYAGEAGCGCPEEEEQPNDKQPPSPPPVRICKGAYGTGPEDACGAILGPEVVGDYCSHCLSFEQKRTDVFANPDNLAEQAMRAAYEYAWQKLADDPRLDPVTVAHCKHLRDLEVRS
jgi:hypothetical protein